MKPLLKLSALIDLVSEALGKVAGYLVLVCCLVSAGNAMVRYTFNYSSNGWLEIQWYMFAFIVLVGASYTLRMNEHVRVDIIYGAISSRTRLWVDIIGIVLFLMPACFYLAWLSWPMFMLSWHQNEMSSNAAWAHPLAGETHHLRRFRPSGSSGIFRTHQAHRRPQRALCARYEVRKTPAMIAAI